MSSETQPAQMPQGVWLHVSVPEQRVRMFNGAQPLWQASVSTSRFGCGETPESQRTPRGWHRIAEKIGAGAPFGAVLKSRELTGEIWDPGAPQSEEDKILTRILWLAGEEPRNASSHERFVYFHGTNREDLIGTPASHGCVRLRNADMLALFDYAREGMRVYIAEAGEELPDLKQEDI